MKLPISSIKAFSDISIELDELLHILRSKIGEVEGYSDWSEMYKGLYIAQIVSKENHPDADKLSVYKITIKEGEDIQVVAGDKTLEIGDKVVYIKPGNIVPLTYKTSEEFVIKTVKMRGILSNGMLCSEKELNIGIDNSKVMRLDSDATVGDTFIKYFDFNDTVIEIENKALTNRGDLFGILGLVREITAAKGIEFHSPKWYTDYDIQSIENKDLLPLKIDNQAHNLCSRYIGVVMDNIKVKQSPVWLKSILIKSSIRPINNIVDITNYLSILVGQPLHAFDYDKVLNKDPKKEAHITIRLAKVGESIHTLDSNLVELNSNTLVIADSTNPIAIAGVIGGLDTEIDSDTKRVILECANFDRFNIRKTSMVLGIFTDAVTRFTKSLDPNQCLPTLKHAISLIEQICEGKLSSEVVDIYPEISLPKKISLSISRVNTHLGLALSKEEVSTILKNLEYTVHEGKKEDDFLTVTAPTFRTDITIPEDIHEDIGRMYGYENITPVFPKKEVKATKRNKNITLKSKIRNILSNSGANEIITYSFVSKNLIERSNQDPNLAYSIKNALSPELSLMRTSLLTSMLSKAQENIQRNIPTFCMYEFNIAHQNTNMDRFQLPKEQWNMSLLFTTKENLFDGSAYYQVKRYLEKVLNTLAVDEIEYHLISDTTEKDLPIWINTLLQTFNPKASAFIMHKESVLGIVGELSGDVINNFKLPKYSGALEINLEALSKLEGKRKSGYSISKYPPITQDISFNVSSDVKYKDIEKIIIDTVSRDKKIATLECIDIYAKEESSKSVTIRITVEHEDKTLSDSEFEKIKEKIVKRVNKIQ